MSDKKTVYAATILRSFNKRWVVRIHDRAARIDPARADYELFLIERKAKSFWTKSMAERWAKKMVRRFNDGDYDGERVIGPESV